jgi:argininosuccinate lyase
MSTEPKNPASHIWGGRFERGPSAVMEEINASVEFDRRLFEQDIGASKAHCQMLVAQGILPVDDGRAIEQGLDTVLAEIKAGQFSFSRTLEDIHMNVEARLRELIGDAAGRLHMARSRNDQVATDFRLWLRDAIDRLTAAIRGLQAALIDQGEVHAETIMPGYTHLQAAQAVTLGHHLLAYVEMFGRDHGRMRDARKRLNECPLGAAALAGTPFPIDRRKTSETLGFDRPMANSLDAVSARDFALEFLSATAIHAVHLSRLAEEIVLWSSERFGFVSLSDAFATGSSIMPQKRNPDAAELVRAKTGRIIGSLTGFLSVVKALPLAYAEDLQEDKEPVFDAVDTIELCLAAMTGMISSATFQPERMRQAAEDGYLTATDLADWLVREQGLPFRQAHHVAGAIVKHAEALDVSLDQVPLADMQAIDPLITETALEVLAIETSVAARMSEGGTAPVRVRQALAAARAKYLDEKD